MYMVGSCDRIIACLVWLAPSFLGGLGLGTRCPSSGRDGRCSPCEVLPEPCHPPHQQEISLSLSCSHRQWELSFPAGTGLPCGALTPVRLSLEKGLPGVACGSSPPRCPVRSQHAARLGDGRLLKSSARSSNLTASAVFMGVSESSVANCLLFNLRLSRGS